ncbi:flagellar biosynthesis protein FlhB [Azovibrio restrictus]|uniref:flagellar biosynthesis protein FlhB n=1 Tax=Azovibrio restrictus TaxID=146938 RepID=UPI0026EF96D2|nr:flagellar biosynthesis protein FlhB [Azovibrio restrictus]
MAEESDLEKTEQPTGRRIEQAREQGQVPHSKELGSFLVLIVAAGVFWLMGGWVVQQAMRLMTEGLTMDAAFLKQPELALLRLHDLALDALITFSPLVLGLIVASILPSFMLNSWVFAPKALMPNLGKLNPIAGIGRMFSWESLMELVKAMLKSLVIGGAAVLIIWSEWEDIFGMLGMPLEAGLAMAGHLLTWSFLLIVAAMLFIVVADVPFQIWQYYDKLKMTKDEVRRESKEMDGDPLVKGRIRSLQREAARRRMMAAVPTADVIVTNPTHFAVALSYKDGMAAPKVLAKGMGAIAQKIKALGAEHGVPMLEAPPLARALYRHVEIDDEIPGALYGAVAEVLAYVYQLSQWRARGGEYPMPPRDVAVPPELAVPEAA